MFGNKDNKNGISLNGGGASHSRNNLVKGTIIDGNITSQSDIRIDGRVNGNINCQAKLVIGPEGYVEGEITCQNAVIEGHVVGNVRAEEKLKLSRSAALNGKITTGSLDIEPGAAFNGACEIINSDTDYVTTPDTIAETAAE